MGYSELIFNFGSTIGAGFLILFGFAFSLSSSPFYSFVFCALLFLVISYIYLNKRKLENKKILKHIPDDWIVFFGEVCWFAICALAIESFLGYFFDFGSFPISTLLLLLPIVILNFGNEKTLLLERMIFTFSILLFSIILPHANPISTLTFSKFSPEFFKSAPIIFIFFLGFEKTLSIFPNIEKNAAKKIIGISILVAFIVYIFLMTQFKNPSRSVVYILDYFSSPIIYFVAAIVIAITFGSMNSSFLSANNSLKRIDYRLFPNTTQKKLFRIFIIFALSSVLVSMKNVLLLAYMVSASYLAFFFMFFLKMFANSYSKNIKWMSFLVIPIILFVFFQIPINILLLFALVFAIGFFFKEK